MLSWSGGKDSSLALAALLADERYEVVALLTSITREYDRVSIHGVRRSLLDAQARALRLPLFEVTLGAASSNNAYETAFRQAVTDFRRVHPDVRHMAFGDLFLSDVRGYRERLMASVGMEPVFPIWGRNTADLAREFVASGYRAHLVCVDTQQLAAEFAGREFDSALLADLPATVDPCGENGEFHTFVSRGPIFRAPIDVEVGELVMRDDRFAYRDLMALREPARADRTGEPVGADVMRDHAPAFIVVDPVLRASTGASLLEVDALRALREELIPLATVITPNVSEAGTLLGDSPARSLAEARAAAERLVAGGARAALVTGGHLSDGDASVDVLCDGSEIHEFSVSRIASNNTHGSGCTLSSAIAVLLATGCTLPQACRDAQRFVARAIAGGADLRVGEGAGPVHQFSALWADAAFGRTALGACNALRMRSAGPRNFRRDSRQLATQVVRTDGSGSMASCARLGGASLSSRRAMPSSTKLR